MLLFQVEFLVSFRLLHRASIREKNWRLGPYPFGWGPRPLGPPNTAHVSGSAKPFSIAGCHGSPEIRFHLSVKLILNTRLAPSDKVWELLRNSGCILWEPFYPAVSKAELLNY